MAASAAKNVRVKVATAVGGPYNVVLGIDSSSMNRSGENVDVTTLSDADVKRLQGVRDCSYDLGGNYEADATGQAVIRSAYENDTALFVQFLPDGATGWQQEVKVSKVGTNAAAKGKIAADFTLEGTGAITTV